MKLHIAHIAGGLTTGGVETVIYNYFSHMDLSDVELTYISYDTPTLSMKLKFEELGFRVYEVTKKKENLFKSCMQVIRIFRERHIDIVHSHMTLMCFVTSFLALLCGIRVRIAHSHLAQQPKGAKRPLYAWFKRLSRISSTDHFACGTDAAIYLFGKSPQKKITFMTNAVDIEQFRFNQASRSSVRARYSLGEALCIGNIGRFTEQKNHMFLIDAFFELKRIRPDSRLLLVGEGPLMDLVRAKVRELSLVDDVIFTGSLDNTAELYHAMDVFALPSLYEGLALVLIEAQCSGVPILVSDTVTTEIALSAFIEHLALSAGSARWASALEKLGSEERYDISGRLCESGYDIKTQAKRLYDFYWAKFENMRN